MPQGLFHAVEQYFQDVEAVMPWNHKIHQMAKMYHQFCVEAAKMDLPQSMFVQDANIGTMGVHPKVAAGFLAMLRHKGGLPGLVSPRKFTTVRTMWQQTKSGLKYNMAASTTMPQFLQGKDPLLTKELSNWEKEDKAIVPIKPYLLEEQVQLFALEAIWYHMQVAGPKIGIHKSSFIFIYIA